MLNALSDFLWPLAKILTVFTITLTFFIISYKFLLDYKTRLSKSKLTIIDQFVSDLPRSEWSAAKKRLYTLLLKAGMPEISYIFEKIELLSDDEITKCKKEICELKSMEKIRKIAKSDKSELERRALAIKILGQAKSGHDVSALNGIINFSKSNEAIYFAIQALGSIKDELSGQILVSLIGSGRFSNSKLASIIERCPSFIILELLKRSKDENPVVRFWIATILGHYPSEITAHHLREMINDRNPDVRAAASESLGSINDAVSIPILHDLLNDSTWFVRLHAVKALGRFMEDESANKIIPLLKDTNWWVRYNAKNVLKKYGAGIAPNLCLTLKSEDRFARNSAMEILEEMDYANTAVKGFSSLDAGVKKAAELNVFDFLKAEGYFWFGSWVKKIDRDLRLSILQSIKSKDEALFDEVEKRIVV